MRNNRRNGHIIRRLNVLIGVVALAAFNGIIAFVKAANSISVRIMSRDGRNGIVALAATDDWDVSSTWHIRSTAFPLHITTFVRNGS